MPINAGEQNFTHLADIATAIERRYVEPAEPKMFYNGEPAVGLAVSMENGGNILALGENLSDTIEKGRRKLMPTGLEIHQSIRPASSSKKFY